MSIHIDVYTYYIYNVYQVNVIAIGINICHVLINYYCNLHLTDHW